MTSTESLTLRSFWGDLPREGKLLLTTVVFQFIGTGLVMPFTVVYLHEVRGFALSDVGLLLALSPLLGFLAVGPGGTAIDRFGARRIMLGTLFLLAAGDVALSLADSLPWAVLGLALSGAGMGLSWPASQSLIAAVVPQHLRQRYFGVNFSLLNLGIGLGGLIGGAIVDVRRIFTFQAMYWADAISFLPPILLLLFPLRHAGGPSGQIHHADQPRTRYLEVIRRPAVGSVMFLSFVASFVGYSQLNLGVQAYGREVGQVSTQGIGIAFAANTAVIVLFQLVVLRKIEGRRRTRVFALMSGLWALSWLFLGASGILPGSLVATIMLSCCAAVFGLGETLLQPTVPALVNDLAPDALRGRYNAVNAGMYQLAAIVAPPVTGFLLGQQLNAIYIATLVVGCVVMGAYAILVLEPKLPPEINGLRSNRNPPPA